MVISLLGTTGCQIRGGRVPPNDSGVAVYSPVAETVGANALVCHTC